MNTEICTPEKEASVKLRLLDSILNNIRYLLGATTVTATGLYIYYLIQHKVPTNSSFFTTIITIVFLLLSGGIFAFVSQKAIIEPYKKIKNMSVLDIFNHLFLTIFWLSGLLFGLIFMFFIIRAILKF